MCFIFIEKTRFLKKLIPHAKIELVPALLAVQELAKEFIESSLFFVFFFASHRRSISENEKIRVQFCVHFFVPALLAVQEQKIASLRSAGNRPRVWEGNWLFFQFCTEI